MCQNVKLSQLSDDTDDDDDGTADEDVSEDQDKHLKIFLVMITLVKSPC